ncbi:hypothetical protein [Chryseobacterium daeguense]|uniref:hypothetical protein n=1 Tax=Chryseobacterium daeguense TaxID=412438 RepID=UPI00040150EC|nr:hypothetical protein [Chryseobacterium daeguense]
MEVKHLRAGNILNAVVSNGKETLNFYEIEVFEILADGIREVKGIKFPYENLIGTPLTEEWLLKFGFTNDDNESWFWSFDFNEKQETFKLFQLTAGGNPFGLWGIVGCSQLIKKIEYVHQLQNLFFALTGEELTLKRQS